MTTLTLVPSRLTLESLRDLWAGARPLAVDRQSRAAVDASAATVARVLAHGETVYGVNTGFGALAGRASPRRTWPSSSATSSAARAGIGPPLGDATVRLVWCCGPGARVRLLGRARRRDRSPRRVPTPAWSVHPRAGVGRRVGRSRAARAPRAALIGEGEVRVDGASCRAPRRSRTPASHRSRSRPRRDSRSSTARRCRPRSRSTGCSRGASRGRRGRGGRVVGRCMPGQRYALRSRASTTCAVIVVRSTRSRRIATCYAAARSARRTSTCPRVQDPYSLRCQPQVMGACVDQMRHAAGMLLTEANAVSDNPLVFADTGEILSGGNFHAEPVAFAADNLALAIAEIGALSERRIALLMDTNLSGLPPFLVEDGGVNSGFMIAQVTAAALAAENKALAHPRERRFAADVGATRRITSAWRLRGATAAADDGPHVYDRRDRVARRVAGRRHAPAAARRRCACAGARRCARVRGALGSRSRLRARSCRDARTC